MLFVCHPQILHMRDVVFCFSWELKWPQEKLKTMLMQNFGVTNKEHYRMLWYFLEWSISFWYSRTISQLNFEALSTYGLLLQRFF